MYQQTNTDANLEIIDVYTSLHFNISIQPHPSTVSVYIGMQKLHHTDQHTHSIFKEAKEVVE